MADFSISVDINAPPNQVMAVLYDVERWPEWTPTMTSVRRMDDGPFTVGSKAQVKQPKLPPAVWQVTELDEKRNFSWITRSPGIQVIGEHRVEANGAGSRVTLSLQFSGLLGPLAARVLRKLNQQYLAIEADGLRRRCES